MTDSRFYRYHGPLRLADILGELSFLDAVTASDIEISGVSALDATASSDLTYVKSKKFISQLSDCQAKYCLCSAEHAEAVTAAGLTPIPTNRPRGDFSVILDKLYSRIGFVTGPPLVSQASQIPEDAVIGPGAVIGDGAELARGVVIEPNAVIGPGVVIGENTRVGAGASISCSLIGQDCRIGAGARIGGDGFGVTDTAGGQRDIPHIGRVLIGNNVSIGTNTSIDRGMLGDTFIGDGTKIDNLVQIGHNVRLGQNVVIAGHCGISGSVVVGDGVQMGGRVGIADHITVGEGAALAAAAAVMKDVPAGEVWSGYPAKPLRQHMREIAILNKMVKGKKL